MPRKSRVAGLSSPIVTSTDSAPAANRTTVPTTSWPVLSSEALPGAVGAVSSLEGALGRSLRSRSVSGTK